MQNGLIWSAAHLADAELTTIQAWYAGNKLH